MKIFRLVKLLSRREVPGAVRTAWGGTARTAESPQEASDLVTGTRPDVLIVSSASWGTALDRAASAREPAACSSRGSFAGGLPAPDEWVGSTDAHHRTAGALDTKVLVISLPVAEVL